ncbi:MAG: OmpA family protein [Candidatus Cryptobacteroides sp.]
MKKLLSIIAAFAVASLITDASAQKREKDEFNPHWFMQVQGGVGHTVGETSFGDLLSPAFGLYGGYSFNPVFGLRVGLSGIQGKAYVAGNRDLNQSPFDFKWNYMQVNADAVLDLCNIFSSFRADRVLNPYIFAGFGANIGFGQDDKVAANFDRFADPDYVWTDSKFFPAGRFGVGLDIRLSKVVYFNLEVNTNILSNKFNCKTSNNVDWQSNLLAGLTFHFGGKGRKAAPAAVPVPAPRPEPVPEQKAEPAPEPEPAPVAVAPQFKGASCNVFFTIGKWNISDAEMSKIEDFVNEVKAADTPVVIEISGYADKSTGTARRNMFLSEKRAEAVKAALTGLGIDESRIQTKFYGSDVNPFQTPAENRVAVCVASAE